MSEPENFKPLDLFSKQANLYAKFRPRYPKELFNFIQEITPCHDVAWDVGTGNGQAAVELADFFQKVIATDISHSQISHAKKKDNVRYLVTPAIITEDTVTNLFHSLGSVDVITIAQAMHWFDFETFFKAVKCALKPSGVIVAWGYGLCSVSPELDIIFKEYYVHTDPYWDTPRKYIDDEYKTIPFPFDPIPGHDSTGPKYFWITKEGSIDDIFGYFESWSPFQKAKDKGIDLLAGFREKMKSIWVSSKKEIQTIRWPVFVLYGQTHK